MKRPDAAAVAQLALLVLGELSWLWAWSQGAGVAARRSAAELVPVAALAGLFALGAVAPPLLARRLRPAAARLARALLGVVAVTAVVELVWRTGGGGPAPWELGWVPVADDGLLLRGIIGGGLAWLAWWRGTALPWPIPTHARVEGAFRLWMGALGALFVLAAAVRDAFAAGLSGLMAAAVVTLAAGLVGMPLARVFDIRREREPEAGVPARVSSEWGWMLGASVTGLLVAAFLLARALVDGTLLSLLHWLEGPARLVAAGVEGALALWGAAWARLVRPVAEGEVEIGGAAGAVGRSVREAAPVIPEGTGGLDWLASASAALTMALLLVLVWRLLARGDRSEMRVGDDGVDEERDFVWPSTASALRRSGLIGLLARLRSPLGARTAARARAARTPAERARHLYRQLLREGERAGLPRDADETPGEYQRALSAEPAFQQVSPELEALTALYNRVRYGEASPRQDELAEGERSIGRVRGAARAARR